MGRSLALSLALSLAACHSGAGGAAGPAGSTAGPPVVDAAVELTAQLPAGARRCVVTRPGAVAARRRPLLRQLSEGNALAWLSSMPVQAYAWAERAAPSGRRPAVTLVRFSKVDPGLRRQLEDEIPFRLAWDDSQCPGGDCRGLRARFVDDHTLQIARGHWPHRGMPGVEARCLELARRHPAAVEVAARRGEVVVAGLEDLVPRRIEVVIRVSGGKVRLLRRQRMATAESAERELREPFDGLGEVAESTIAEHVVRSRQGTDIVMRMRFVWEDLRLALAEQRRLRTAFDRERRGDEPLPVSSVDVSSLAGVWRQVRLRSAELAASHGVDRRDEAQALRRLLERAVAEHPAELELARRLVEVLLDELGDGRAAEQVAEDVLRRHPDDAGWWRLARREARASTGPERLAEALVQDEIVRGAAASRAASDLVRLLRAGVEYDWAESAWTAADALGRDVEGRPMASVPRASLPLSSLAATLVTVAQLDELGDAPPRAAYLLVRAASTGEVVYGQPTPPLLEVHDGGRRTALLGAATTGRDGRLRDLDERLAAVLESGEVEIVVAFVPLHARETRPKPALHVRGRIDGDELVIERTGRAGRGVPWQRVARYVGRALASIENRLFPPPDLEVEASRTADARRFVELAEQLPDVECRRRGLRVECTAPLDATEQLERAIERFAAEQL